MGEDTTSFYNQTYDSPAGQLHVHMNCICAVPGILKQIQTTDSTSTLLELKNRLQICCPDDLYQELLTQYIKIRDL